MHRALKCSPKTTNIDAIDIDPIFFMHQVSSVQ